MDNYCVLHQSELRMDSRKGLELCMSTPLLAVSIYVAQTGWWLLAPGALTNALHRVSASWAVSVVCRHCK
jgi:hypothetical protein